MYETKVLELYKFSSDFLEEKEIKVTEEIQFSLLDLINCCYGFDKKFNFEILFEGLGSKVLDFKENIEIIENEKDVVDFLSYILNGINEFVSYFKEIEIVKNLDLGGIVN